MAESVDRNQRLRRFIRAYLAKGNAREAARRTGFDPVHARRLLHSAEVRRILQEAIDEKAARDDGRVASAREVLEYLTDVLRGEADAEGRQSASSPRMKAAELLGKRLGIFTEPQEAAPPPVIIDDIGPPPGNDGG